MPKRPQSLRDIGARDLSKRIISELGLFCVMPLSNQFHRTSHLCGDTPDEFDPLPLCRYHAKRLAEWATDMVDRRNAVWAAERLANERAREEARPQKESFIYFAMKAGKMKIGTTVDVRTRLKVQQVEPVLILRGDRVGEREMHLRFVHLRCPKPGERSLSTEWFHYEPELQEFVERTRQTQLERHGTTLLDELGLAP